jgi:hypothetical protein
MIELALNYNFQLQPKSYFVVCNVININAFNHRPYTHICRELI